MSWRGTLAGCQVILYQHLDGTLSITYGPHRLGRYTAQGVAITANPNPGASAVEKALSVESALFAFLRFPSFYARADNR